MVETGAQLGPYRLIRRIGAGGMAEVFLAQRIGAEGFARTVAIKTILALGAEEEGVGLFLDEARVASYLEHAAIVQTVDLGFEDNTLFIVMEYVAGPALSRIIKDLKKLGKSLSPEVVAHVGARVASALDYAANRATTPDGKLLNLVHRDISPQNILITRGGTVKLTDFGVARASVQTHKTRTGQVRGKAAYMAPEQVRAGQLDGRTDIFGLALVLYEALTGVRAFQRSSDIMSMRAILTDEVAPIRDTNPSVSVELAAVLNKALAKNPENRWPTGQVFAEALSATNRSRSETAIEAEIAGVLTELFGPEQFGTADLKVEPWQPPVTAAPESAGPGSHPTPHRLSASQLSPQIAAMLQQPPTGSALPTRPGALVEAVDTEGRPLSAYYGVMRAEPESVASLPGLPVMGNTGVQMLGGEMPFAGPLPGGTGVPVGGTNVRTATALELIETRMAMRPSSAGGLIWAVAGLGGILALALGVFLVSRAEEVPLVDATPLAAPTAAPTPAAARRLEPTLELHTTPGEAAIKPTPRPPRTAPTPEPARAQAEPPKSTPEPPKAAEAAAPSLTSILERVNRAKQKTKDPGLQKALGSLFFDVQLSHKLTPEGEALLQRVEQAP